MWSFDVRTRKGIEQTITGMLIRNFNLKGNQNKIAETTAKEIITFLHDEEKNLIIPPIESPWVWFKKMRLWIRA